MQNIVEQITSRVNAQDLKMDIAPEHVSRIISSLDEKERTVSEISRLAKVPSAFARVVLSTMEKLDDSPVKSNYMRFRLSESNKNNKDNLEQKKSLSLKNIPEIITSIIKILHERPQTVSSLSDELSIDTKTCQTIIDKLEAENAVSKTETEWEEVLYNLDEDGYADYISRSSERAKIHSSSKAADIVKENSKYNTEVADNADSNLISVEDMVVKILEDNGKCKISALVKNTDAAITRVDIEDALGSLEKKNIVSVSNHSAKYPYYFLSSQNEGVDNKEKASAKTIKAKSKVVAEKEVGVAESTPSKIENIITMKESVAPSKQTTFTEVKKDAEKVAMTVNNQENEPKRYSSYSEIAALQIAMEDVLEGATVAQVSRINAAIQNIENEKTRVKNAISNLNKTINELF
jgi:predicted transcriptional regulator